MYRWALAMMCVVATAAFAQTDVRQSDITTNTTWTLSGSPYYIYGDLYILNGATLTINGGVEVRFVEIHGDGGYEDGAELVVRNGVLVTRGTDQVPVKFTSANTAKLRGDWGAIVVEGSNQYILTGAVIEYAKNGLRLASTSSISAGRSSTESTIIRWCSNNGVYAYYASASFYHLTVTENDYAGIKTTGSCSITAGNSDLCSNGMYNYYNGGASNVDATDCWWGTTTPSLIELRIYDKHDSPASGTVDYTPYLSAPWRDQGNVTVYSLGFVKSIFQ